MARNNRGLEDIIQPENANGFADSRSLNPNPIRHQIRHPRRGGILLVKVKHRFSSLSTKTHTVS